MKQKKIICAISAIAIVIATIIPCFAYAPIGVNITYIDTTRENTPSYFNIQNNFGDVNYVRFDYNVDGIEILIGQESSQMYTIYYMPIINYEYLYIECYCAGDDYFNGYMGHYEDAVSTLAGAVEPSVTHQTIKISITMYNTNLYSESEIKEINDTAYGAGVQSAKQNANQYGLYTEQERNDYGRQQYAEGKIEGVREGMTADEYTAYMAGIEQGYKSSNTLKGVANVILTNIYNVFTNFTGNAGIWGTTLISILVSAVIILIIYFIFKLERS